MIPRYSDHAANERTFLAWVRTAIAVMAFGFLVEKFDLFLEAMGSSLSGRLISPRGEMVGNIAGLLLILLGGVTMLLATVRFRRTALAISSEETKPASGDRIDYLLVAMLILLGSALFAYLSYTVLRRI